MQDSRFIDTGCPRRTTTDYLPILTGIQPAKFRRQRTTFSLAYCNLTDPDYPLHHVMVDSTNVYKDRLRSCHPFVPAALKLLRELSEMSTRAVQKTDYI